MWVGDIDRTNNWQIFFTTETLPACTSTLKYSGDTVTLQATPKDGIGPYHVEFLKNGVLINSLRLDGPNPIDPATENAQITRIYTLDDADIVGTSIGKITFSVFISDSCPTGAKTCTATCDVYIGCIAPVCNFTVT